MASGPITSWQVEGKDVEAVTDFIFLGSKITADSDCNHEIKRYLLLGSESYDKLSILESRDITLLTKVHIVQAVVFPVVLCGCESWNERVPRNWWFRTVVVVKSLESPLGCKEIKPVNPKENQPWIFIRRTDVEAEAPILWPPDVKNWLIGKDPDAGRDWGQEEKGTTEDEMAGWHH